MSHKSKLTITYLESSAWSDKIIFSSDTLDRKTIEINSNIIGDSCQIQFEIEESRKIEEQIFYSLKEISLEFYSDNVDVDSQKILVSILLRICFLTRFDKSKIRWNFYEIPNDQSGKRIGSVDISVSVSVANHKTIPSISTIQENCEICQQKDEKTDRYIEEYLTIKSLKYSEISLIAFYRLSELIYQDYQKDRSHQQQVYLPKTCSLYRAARNLICHGSVNHEKKEGKKGVKEINEYLKKYDQNHEDLNRHIFDRENKYHIQLVKEAVNYFDQVIFEYLNKKLKMEEQQI